ncbi:tetratricopeptide repeat protein [Croceimicrobium hydrocarbonivorans]|uniref:Tetratricopeptide repeat protein n=1 Tax=Croceimicrobium hydrocarbonivorans TaxID=2761580 RepID=A0A7H0VAD9_9FLAO|nr:tetratricopeptide repeat protein [Croceimicrobium hydrocarbonivorans]QNR22687.1 tetratricopeptide repeat protein [Croceimicrobium hydrocarbonivorans]
MFRAVILVLANLLIAQFSLAQGLSLREKTQAMVKAKGLSEGIKYYENLSLKEPKNLDWKKEWAFLLTMHNTEEALTKADSILNSILSIDSLCSVCWQLKGEIEFDRANYSVALGFTEKSLVHEETKADAHFLRSKVYASLNETWKSKHEMDAALRLKPEESKYHLGKGIIELGSGFTASALTCFKRAMELDSSQFAAPYLMGRCYLNMGLISEAIEGFQQAIRLDSTEATAYYYLAGALERNNQFEASFDAVSKAILLDPEKSEYLFHRAWIRYRLEDTEGSCTDYNLLIAKFSDSDLEMDSLVVLDAIIQVAGYCDSSLPAYYYQRGIAEFNLKNYTKALTWYDKGLHKFPGEPNTLSFKANALLVLERYPEAVEYYKEYFNSQEDLSAEYRASLKYRGGTEKDLEVIINNMIPSNRNSLAEAYLHLGDMDNAKEQIALGLEKEWSLEPMIAAVLHTTKGRIFYQENELAKAKYEFEKALNLFPQLSQTHLYLALLKLEQSQKVKISQSSISFESKEQPFSLTWFDNANSKEEASKDLLSSAIGDCSRALLADPTNGQAYYLKAQIKILLGDEDFCYDLLSAEQLGVQIKDSERKKCIE